MIVRPKPLGLRLPGLRAEVDPLQRISLGINAEGAQFEPAFELVARLCLNGQMGDLSANGALVVTFIVSDAIADESALQSCWIGMRNAFSSKGLDYAYWTDPLGRADCRVISSQTKICIDKALKESASTDWESVIPEVEAWLRKSIGVQFLLAKRCSISALTAVLRGAVAFWQRLSGIFHTHILGLQHMTPLSEASLARLETGMAQARPDVQDDGVADAAEREIDSSVARANEFEPIADSPIADNISDLLNKMAKGGYAKQRREKIEGLLRLCPSVPQTDGHGSLLMATAMHFLVVGTPEASSPSMKIVGAYVKDLHIAFSQLAGGLSSALVTDESELAEVYESLIDLNPGCRYLQSAIGAFHSFVVSRFGMAPIWVRGRRRDIPVIPNAEILHQHEIDRLLTEISSSSGSKRVRRLATAMIWLALDVPIRISDVLRLRIEDVRGTFPAMFVDIRHRSNDPREKARATLRTVLVRDESAAAALADLKSLRLGESINTRGRLFGDGFKAPTIADATRAYALVNRLIKQITGVNGIGFHVLRHTCISLDVQRALLSKAATLSWEVLEECSARSGHASPVTTIVTYSHLCAFPMRHAINEVLDRLLTVRGVSRWCCVSENTLSKRRSGNEGVKVLRAAMKSAADKIALRSAAAASTTSASEIPALPSQPIGLIEVLLMIEAIGTGMSDSEIAEGSGHSEDVVARLREAFRLNRRERSAQFKRTHWQQTKWAGVLEKIRSDPSSPAVQSALQSWRSCSSKGRLDARDSALLDALLRFLCEAGVPAARLLVRSVNPEGERATAVANLVTAIFDASPAIERVPKKKGRVGDYLYVVSKAQAVATKTAASAATSMRGLDAIFTAVAILGNLDQKRTTCP